MLFRSGLVDNDRRCEALRVRFTADGKADASEGGGRGVSCCLEAEGTLLKIVV